MYGIVVDAISTSHDWFVREPIPAVAVRAADVFTFCHRDSFLYVANASIELLI